MRDPRTGQVWRDTAGEVNGDNSDNHWTDNLRGTADDRHVTMNPPSADIQWTFVYLQALAAQTFAARDPEYSQTCLRAAHEAYRFGTRLGGDVGTLTLGLKLLALGELLRCDPSDDVRGAAEEVLQHLLERQNRTGAAGRGAFRATESDESRLFHHAWLSGIPAVALLETLELRLGDVSRVKGAVREYIEEFMKPLLSQSLFRIMPYGVWSRPPSPERYRSLGERGYYRYFMPVRQEGAERRPVRWWVGTTSHLFNHALVLALAERHLGRREYRDWAYSQIQWLLGGNPFQASLMTGHGVNQPWPHSRFVGLIPGGIMNGIGGDEGDRPVLDQENGLKWQTNEYWSPHNAFYLMSLAILEDPRRITQSIGVISHMERR